MWNNVINAWWSIVFYSANDAPQFKPGMIAMLCACVATLAVTYLVYFLERREWASQSKDGSSKHSSPSTEKADPDFPNKPEDVEGSSANQD